MQTTRSWAVGYFDDLALAKSELSNAGVDHYVPMQRRWTRPARKHAPVVVNIALIAHLSFIKYDEKIYDTVKRVRGFRRFLRIKGEIGLARDEEVERMRSDEEAGYFDFTNIVAPKHSFVIGDHVTICLGAATGRSGIIQKIKKDTLTVLDDHTQWPMILAACQVEPAPLY